MSRRKPDSGFAHGWRKSRRHNRDVKNVTLVEIFRRRKSDHLPVETPRHDHGQLRFESGSIFRARRAEREILPSLFNIDVSLELQLTLSVISEIGCLQHRGRSDKPRSAARKSLR